MNESGPVSLREPKVELMNRGEEVYVGCRKVEKNMGDVLALRKQNTGEFGHGPVMDGGCILGASSQDSCGFEGFVMEGYGIFPEF